MYDGWVYTNAKIPKAMGMVSYFELSFLRKINLTLEGRNNISFKII